MHLCNEAESKYSGKNVKPDTIFSKYLNIWLKHVIRIMQLKKVTLWELNKVYENIPKGKVYGINLENKIFFTHHPTSILFIV